MLVTANSSGCVPLAVPVPIVCRLVKRHWQSQWYPKFKLSRSNIMKFTDASSVRYEARTGREPRPTDYHAVAANSGIAFPSVTIGVGRPAKSGNVTRS